MESNTHPTLVAPRDLSSFSLGYNQIVGDLLWIRTIQDFDFCENRPAGGLNVAGKCRNGWVYKMIDAITEVDPRFYKPYVTGALMLNVVVNDIEGASKIFDKGEARFPNEWDILYYGAYHAMAEEKNYVKAGELLKKAADHGAPKWTYSLAARLNQKSGQLELAKSIMEKALNDSSDDSQAEYFKKRLAEINAEIAKQPAATRAAPVLGQPSESSKH